MIPLLVVAGPTASGKTGLAIEVARLLGAEIICADSRQVYRGMDIGTAKPTYEERARAPHHLLDRVLPEEKYSAGRFAREAAVVARNLYARGKVSLVCGGTGFYINALLSPMFEEPEIDPEALKALRNEYRKRAAAGETAALYHELELIDPAAAARLHQNDFQRISRALEIHRLTGHQMSALHEGSKTAAGAFRALEVVLDPPAQTLKEHIETRTYRMIEQGWLGEVRALLARGVSIDSPGFQSLGYREMAAVAQGKTSLDRAREEIMSRTWQYARRQRTWFRRMTPGLRLENTEGQAHRIAQAWREFVKQRG